MTFVAIAPFAWGKSETSADAAIREAKRHIPGPPYVNGKYKGQVFEVEDFTGVDGMGRIGCKGAPPRLIRTFDGMKKR